MRAHDFVPATTCKETVKRVARRTLTWITPFRQQRPRRSHFIIGERGKNSTRVCATIPVPCVTRALVHCSYLKEFRVEQCQLFLQHKCTQHRPFTCFNWHFMNQRRRRPARLKEGSFNYSPDLYCSVYDETTGICPNGDE